MDKHAQILDKNSQSGIFKEMSVKGLYVIEEKKQHPAMNHRNDQALESPASEKRLTLAKKKAAKMPDKEAIKMPVTILYCGLPLVNRVWGSQMNTVPSSPRNIDKTE